MPRTVCKKCGKVWRGWALMHKKCVCDCGEILN